VVTQYRGKGSGRTATIKLLQCHLERAQRRKQSMPARKALAHSSLHGHVKTGHRFLLAAAVVCSINSRGWHALYLTRPVVRASRPTTPSAGEPVPTKTNPPRPSALWSTAQAQGLSRLCWAPHGLRSGKGGIFGLSEYPLRCDYRLRRSAKGIKSCARRSNTIASIDGSKDGRTGLYGDNACDR